MQSHAGEHIVSGVVHSLFGYDNVGFHMSEKTMTVDFSGPLTAEDIAKVELESNKAIYKNAPIREGNRNLKNRLSCNRFMIHLYTFLFD